MMNCFDRAMMFYKEGNYQDALNGFKKAIEEGINVKEAEKYVKELEAKYGDKSESSDESSEKEEEMETEDDGMEEKPIFDKGGIKIVIKVMPDSKPSKNYLEMKKKFAGGDKWQSDTMSNN